MNVTSLVGRLVRDVDLNYTGNGTAVANITVAVDRRFKNAHGEYEADFIDVVVWRQAAEFVSKHFKKGSPIAVTGSIQTRNYENKEGRKVYVTEVVADHVGFVPRDNSQPQQVQKQENPFANAGTDSNPFVEDSNEATISDDDLPF